MGKIPKIMGMRGLNYDWWGYDPIERISTFPDDLLNDSPLPRGKAVLPKGEKTIGNVT